VPLPRVFMALMAGSSSLTLVAMEGLRGGGPVAGALEGWSWTLVESEGWPAGDGGGGGGELVDLGRNLRVLLLAATRLRLFTACPGAEVTATFPLDLGIGSAPLKWVRVWALALL